jgi:hypothetical protein
MQAAEEAAEVRDEENIEGAGPGGDDVAHGAAGTDAVAAGAAHAGAVAAAAGHSSATAGAFAGAHATAAAGAAGAAGSMAGAVGQGMGGGSPQRVDIHIHVHGDGGNYAARRMEDGSYDVQAGAPQPPVEAPAIAAPVETPAAAPVETPAAAPMETPAGNAGNARAGSAGDATVATPSPATPAATPAGTPAGSGGGSAEEQGPGGEMLDQGLVKGRVYDITTGAGVSHAEVHLEYAGQDMFTDVSDGQAKYKIHAPSAAYEATATAEGYCPASESAQYPEPNRPIRRRLALSPILSAGQVRIHLTTKDSLKLSTYGPGGCVIDSASSSCGEGGVEAVAQMWTDKGQTVTFTHLADGVYRVYATSEEPLAGKRAKVRVYTEGCSNEAMRRYKLQANRS